MSTVAEKTLVSPEDLLRMPDRKDFELIDGVLVRRHGEGSEGSVSILSSWVGGKIVGRIDAFCEGKGIGWVFPADGGFQCFPDRPKTVRMPDVSFVKSGRMTWDQLTDGWLRIIPDLVVEVISPSDKAYELDQKIEMFLKVGVPLIWVVNPNVRNVRVIRGDGSTATLREGDQLSGEDVIPGFACPVASIFPPTAPAVPVVDAPAV